MLLLEFSGIRGAGGETVRTVSDAPMSMPQKCQHAREGVMRNKWKGTLRIFATTIRSGSEKQSEPTSWR